MALRPLKNGGKAKQVRRLTLKLHPIVTPRESEEPAWVPAFGDVIQSDFHACDSKSACLLVLIQEPKCRLEHQGARQRRWPGSSTRILLVGKLMG